MDTIEELEKRIEEEIALRDKLDAAGYSTLLLTERIEEMEDELEEMIEEGM